jgi:ATP-dependent protease ClpP protease subunit
MTGDVFIYGEIGKEVTVDTVRAQLDPKYDSYTLHIISVGGDVFQGYGIYNILKNTGKEITTHVEGICASIATLIALAGSKIVMNKTSQWMIHNPQISGMQGDSSQLRNAADQLDKIKTLLIDVSHRKTHKSKELLWDLYNRETWQTSDEALAFGFADEVQDAIKAVAKADIKFLNSEIMDKTEAKTFFDKVDSKMNVMFKAIRSLFKNQMELTLEDGTPIIVMANPDEDPNGKQIMRGDGAPLEAGTYKISTGETVTVSGEGLITAWEEGTAEDKTDRAKPAEKTEEEKQKEEQEMKALDEANKTIETLKAQLAEKETQAAAKATEVTNLSTQFTNMKKELDEMKKATFGDPNPPGDAADKQFMNMNDPNKFDPMGEDVLKELRARRIVN